MSGGAFNYLCYKDSNELFSEIGELEAMAAALQDLGAEDAAAETLHVVAKLQHFRLRMNVTLERLQDVWQAVEWNRSGDWSKDRIEDALVEYRKEIEP